MFLLEAAPARLGSGVAMQVRTRGFLVDLREYSRESMGTNGDRAEAKAQWDSKISSKEKSIGQGCRTE